MSTIQVESFVPDEFASDLEDPSTLESRQALINKLGLTGQKSTTTAEPMSFPVATLRQAAVIQALYPTSTALINYTAQSLPLRVLELADRASIHFGCLTVWHSEDSREGPFLIGTAKSYYENPKYLICRWGTPLKSWSELEADYMKRVREIFAKLTGRYEALATELKSRDAFIMPPDKWNATLRDEAVLSLFQ